MRLPFAKLVLATHSQGKLREFRYLLADWPCEVVSAADAGCQTPPEETGETYWENALLKAQAVAKSCGHWTLADDTGLEVDCLGGMPGVRSGRFASDHAEPGANRQKLIATLAERPSRPWDARFVCQLILTTPDGTPWASGVGICRGQIQPQPTGTRGFGYDTLFLLPEHHRTMAELTPVVMAHLGHRGRAIGELRRNALSRNGLA